MHRLDLLEEAKCDLMPLRGTVSMLSWAAASSGVSVREAQRWYEGFFFGRITAPIVRRSSLG